MAEENKTPEEMTIEESFDRLQNLLNTMSRDDLPLEESFTCYEEGMKLIRSVNGKIDQVEKKVLKLSEDGTLEEF